jgi:hypothetical protein
MTILTILALFGFLAYTPIIGQSVFSAGRAGNGPILLWAFFLTSFVSLKWLV